MERAFLKLMLSGKNTIKSTIDYCSNSNVCQRNKDIFVKKLLNISGYKIPKNAMPIPIYEELVELSKRKPANELDDLESNIKMTPAFIDIISRRGSDNLRSFLAFNDIIIPARRNKFLEIKDRLSGLYSNPLVSSTLIPLATKYAASAFSDISQGSDQLPRRTKVSTKKSSKKTKVSRK